MALVIEGVTCGYGDATVLSDVSFQVEEGQVTALLGPNGVGKTTLFKTILGLLPAKGGRILLDGRPASEMSRAERAQAMAYVPQVQDIPFSYSVEDVVLMGRAPHLKLLEQPGPQDRRIVREVMESLGISHLAKKDCTEISGGEMQMVAIARALAQQPRYLVMDEPTASLDFGNQVRVLRWVRALQASGIGVLMTTHDPEQAFLLQSNVVLLRRDGTCSEGFYREVLTEKALSATYGVEVLVGSLEHKGRTVECCTALLDVEP